MRNLNAFITEDSNQFGPGTDLILALLALCMVMVTVTSFLYTSEKGKREEIESLYTSEKGKREQLESGGKFKVAQISFSAGTFREYPVTELVDREATRRLVAAIVSEYRKSSADYPYLFIIGHANEKDAVEAADRGESARMERNWLYAGRRAAVIAALLQEELTTLEKDKLVVVTTGEFDKTYPEDPESQDNALVEVVFAKDWKRPARETLRTR